MEIDDDIEQKLIEIQMEETRASLSTKLEALETQVAETVQTATDAVQTATQTVAETVGSVKDSVGEIRDKVGSTVRSVTNAFDLSLQVEERPWVVFGAAVGAGCLLGWLLPSARHAVKGQAPRRSMAAALVTPTQTPPPIPPEPSQPGWMSNQIAHLRGLAVGTAMGAIRDLAKQALPEAIRDRVAHEIDNLTPHLGGEVIPGQILPDLQLGAVAPSPPEEHSGQGIRPNVPHPAEAWGGRGIAAGRS